MTCGLPPRGGLSDVTAKSDLNPRELVEITCAVARIASMLCNVMQVPGAPGVSPRVGWDAEPYIWDIPED